MAHHLIILSDCHYKIALPTTKLLLQVELVIIATIYKMATMNHAINFIVSGICYISEFTTGIKLGSELLQEPH